MGRKKQFDRDNVIQAAIDVFRRKGFLATRIQDVVESTGLNRSSIYAEFGSKEGLFDQAIDRYMTQSISQKVIEAPRDEPLLDLLRRLLMPIVEGASVDATPEQQAETGCLFIAAVMEIDDQADPFMHLMKAQVGRFEAELYGRILVAQERGEISADNDAMGLARVFISGLHGLRVSTKITPDTKVLGDIVDQLLSQIAGRKLSVGTQTSTPALQSVN